jgi:hypothetical protein
MALGTRDQALLARRREDAGKKYLPSKKQERNRDPLG